MTSTVSPHETLLDALRAFCGDHEATGFECAGLNAAYLHAKGVIADVERSGEDRLHVLEPPVRVLGLWYVQCSCGWLCDGSLSIGEAQSTMCGVERAQLEGLDNKRRFQRAQRIDAKGDTR